MNIRLSQTQSRAAAVGLLLLVLVLIIGGVAWPVWRLHQHYDHFIDDYSDRLSRYRRIAALKPAIEEATAALGKRDSRKFYLKSTTPSAAAAELQGMVAKIVDSHKGRVASSQILAGKDDPKAAGPTKVSVTVQLNAAIIPLQMILHTVETQDPYLFIDQLTVRANQGRNYKPQPGVEPEFGVQLTLHGYITPAQEAP